MFPTFTLIRIREAILAEGRKKETYRSANGQEAEMDRTGRVVDSALTFPIAFDTARRVAFSFNDNAVAYSYWRAQELSLFWREMDNYERPILDFGCGDGFFSSNIFKSLEYGVDIDRTALAVAAQYHIYQELLTFDEMIAQVGSGTVGTVFSCSVLEHTDDLTTCLSEIGRVIKPGGKFFFTVPSPHFTEHMATLADRTFADRMNARMYHRNLLDDEEWRRRLADAGLRMTRLVEFQPLSFTAKYFRISLLGNRTVGRIPGFRKWYWRRHGEQLIEDVAQSLSGNVKNGANYFIVAEK